MRWIFQLYCKWTPKCAVLAEEPTYIIRQLKSIALNQKLLIKGDSTWTSLKSCGNLTCRGSLERHFWCWKGKTDKQTRTLPDAEGCLSTWAASCASRSSRRGTAIPRFLRLPSTPLTKESAAWILGINNWIISPVESSEDSGAVGVFLSKVKPIHFGSLCSSSLPLPRFPAAASDSWVHTSSR